jgi:hypothetical protein
VQVINVTDTSDAAHYDGKTVSVANLAGQNNVTLIDAINAADNGAASDTYVINLAQGATYTLVHPDNPATDANATGNQDNNWYGPNGLPAIANNITINGNGSSFSAARPTAPLPSGSSTSPAVWN